MAIFNALLLLILSSSKLKETEEKLSEAKVYLDKTKYEREEFEKQINNKLELSRVILKETEENLTKAQSEKKKANDEINKL